MGRQEVGLTAATSNVLQTLGSVVREARVSQDLPREEVALRAGVSTYLVRQVEEGNPGTAIGNVLKVLVALRLPVFGVTDEVEYSRMANRSAERLGLLPARAAKPRKDPGDDFPAWT